MTAYVTIATFQGLIDDVQAFGKEQSALDAEQDWLRNLNINDEETREAKSDNGTGFSIHECELKS